MRITIENNLNNGEKSLVSNLVLCCNNFDNTKNDLFLSNEFNLYHEMNCFFLYYDNNELLGFLSIYADNKYIAEISSYVLPQHRKNGIFNLLYSNAKKELKKFNYSTVHLVTEKAFISNTTLIDKFKWRLSSTEYLLEYNKSTNAPVLKPKDNLIVRYSIKDDLSALAYVQMEAFEDSYESCENYVTQSFKNNNIILYSALFNKEIIGTCCVDTAGKNNLIFGLCIMPKFQGKGVGGTLLRSVIKDLIDLSNKALTLCVESENKRALKLYTSCGFDIASEIQYYESKI